MTEAGFEVRPAIMRLYFSFRGGDRPKNAEAEFPKSASAQRRVRAWMLFRKPIDKKTVAENLRRWKTGALRRLSTDKPLPDAIPSGRTPNAKKRFRNHPCLKPQHFMRIMVRALLPLEGTILDPSWVRFDHRRAEAVGYIASGLELDSEYFRLAERSIPRLAALYRNSKGRPLTWN